MTTVSDYSFYGGGGFGGINKCQEPKTVYVPMLPPVDNNLPNKLLRSLVPRVYKVAKKRTEKKKKSVRKSAKKTRKVVSKKHKKHKKSKKANTKESKFQNF